MAGRMQPLRCAVLDDYQEIALRALRDVGIACIIDVFSLSDHTDDEGVLAGRLADADVIVLMRERTPMPASLLARLPKLKLLITTGGHNASIDLAACERQGVAVGGTPGIVSATPELTWALLLGLARRIPTEHANVQAGRWQSTVGLDLEGRTLGIVGLGRIGKRVAKVAQAFGMRVIAWSQNLTDEAARAEGVERVGDVIELCKQSDFLTIHTKLSDRTRGLIGPDALMALGPRGLLVNTSRGPIVEERALVLALQQGIIGGAALDTYDIEPLPQDHPLRSAPNTVLTPHIGYGTDATYQAYFAGVRAQLEAWATMQTVLIPLKA